ncbi:hypothetical protein INT44_007181 [Umbelopsis vinacea]|uniref:Uncharacterized protein n=1 Tax=Umbelopsis vinacea TaxID=44442 RepID=A0A8H7PME7_9FUNG|nr:hypothetical protein INT44_007181 [Umbelopsis vinacea]
MTAAALPPSELSDRLYILGHQVFFLLSGLCQTLGAQWLFYSGAATGSSYFTQVAQYFGMIWVGLLLPIMNSRKQAYTKLPTKSEDDSVEGHGMTIISTVDINGEEDDPEHKSKLSQEGPIHHKSIFKLACVEVVANFTVSVGFYLVGSGMYQVIYSSVVIWCAILSYLTMGRTLTPTQWVAIMGTSVGLAISAMGNTSQGDATSAPLLIFGMILTLSGTFFYSCVYVFSDHILSQQVPGPSPIRVCSYVGAYCTVLSVIWISVYTIPRFDELIHVSPDVSMQSIAGMYGLLILASATHAWNYYELIGRTGNVATGILQGLRAILVFGLSHFWYCSSDSAQCFTVWKGWGSVMVVGCVLMFTLGGKSKQGGSH